MAPPNYGLCTGHDKKLTSYVIRCLFHHQGQLSAAVQPLFTPECKLMQSACRLRYIIDCHVLHCQTYIIYAWNTDAG